MEFIEEGDEPGEGESGIIDADYTILMPSTFFTLPIALPEIAVPGYKISMIAEALQATQAAYNAAGWEVTP